MSWSSGKDSAWALHTLRIDSCFAVDGLFTVVNEKYDRASMHATRSELLRIQAECLGLPLQIVRIPDPCSMERCNEIMGAFVAECAGHGVECMAFGDLFLEDIREYREKQLEGTGIAPVFPLWGIPTGKLAATMIDSGVEAYVSSVDLKKLPRGMAGRRWSKELIAEFPGGCDPCGENGEIHTIVVNGPMFRRSVPVYVGEVVVRDGFAYADIVPVT